MAKKRRPRKATRPDATGMPERPNGAPRSTSSPGSVRAGSSPSPRPRSPIATRRAAAQAARKRRQRLRAGLFGAAAAVLLGGVVALAASSGSSVAGTRTSPTSWVLPRLGGSGTVSLASLRGKPVVVNMFASWCTECEAELPAFTSEAQRLRGKVTFVEVNSLETGNGEAMARQFGLAAAGAIVLADVGGAQNSGLHDALGGGNNMPVTAFYGASGQLLTSHVGAFSASTLQAELTQLYGPGV